MRLQRLWCIYSSQSSAAMNCIAPNNVFFLSLFLQLLFYISINCYACKSRVYSRLGMRRGRWWSAKHDLRRCREDMINELWKFETIDFLLSHFLWIIKNLHREHASLTFYNWWLLRAVTPKSLCYITLFIYSQFSSICLDYNWFAISIKFDLICRNN